MINCLWDPTLCDEPALTTLVGERGDHVWSEVVDAASSRSQQISRVLGLVEGTCSSGQPLILMGDFNAQVDEYSIKDMLERDHQFVQFAQRKYTNACQRRRR